MVDKLLNMALLGGESILYLLIGLSLISVGVIIERYVVYIRSGIDAGAFTHKLVSFLNKDQPDEALKLAKQSRSPEAAVVVEGLLGIVLGIIKAFNDLAFNVDPS